MNSDTKTALITGSGQNIGRGIAHHLATDGFNIIVNGSSTTTENKGPVKNFLTDSKDLILDICAEIDAPCVYAAFI